MDAQDLPLFRSSRKSMLNSVPIEKKKEGTMESLKQEAANAISKMNDAAEIDDIMYRLYVIDKVRKGREAAERGDTVSTEELRKEIETW